MIQHRTYLFLLSVILILNCVDYSICFPQKISDRATQAPAALHNLRDIDEELVTDSDADFESRKLQPRETAADEQQPDSQHFFPSFASLFPNHPLGHSRPSLYDDPPSNHRPRHIPYALQQANSFHSGNNDFFNNNNNNYNQQSSTQTSAQSKGTTSDQNVLGSGNFGVIRGGTFYEDDYDNDDYFYPYNNGHGRPTNNFNNYYNHQPANSNEDFFSNFRDFADITAPKSAAYSEFHVIYVNKNGTEVENPSASKNTKPRNIFEQLTKLDEAESKEQLKKGINNKKKLELHKEKENEKYYKKKQALASPKEYYHEPLLALS